MDEEFLLKLLINDGAIAGICIYLIRSFSERIDKLNASIDKLAETLGKRLGDMERDIHDIKQDMRK